MNIAIDASPAIAQDTSGRGIGLYTERLIQAFPRATGSEDSLIASYYNGLMGEEPLLSCERARIYLGPYTGKDKWLLSQPALSGYGARIILSFLTQNAIDAFHVPDFASFPFDFFEHECLRKADVVFSTTVHDLIPLAMERIYLPTPERKQEYLKKLQILQHMDVIFADSNATKQDIIRFVGIPEERIAVSYLAPISVRSQEGINGMAGHAGQRWGVKKSYILYTGGDDYRKNIEGLIRAYAAASQKLRQSFQLVIVCKLYNKAHYLALIHSLGLELGVILTGYVTDEELHELYAQAAAFVFPSMYEGFGLPVLEAMAYDLPIAASNVSSIPELAGDAALLFDPENVEEMAGSLERIALDEELRTRLVAQGKVQRKKFGWEECARSVYEGLSRACALKEAPVERIPTKRKPKVAMLTPLNPDQTGIADYSEDLIPSLDAHFELDLYSSTAEIDNIPIRESHAVRPYAAFDGQADSYDAIIYQMGNSEWHLQILNYMRKYPGIVVLHDYNERVFFDYLGNWKPDSTFGKAFIIENFFLQYGERGFALYNQVKDLCHDRRIEFNQFSIANALGVIVHSRFARDHLMACTDLTPISVVRQSSPPYPASIDDDKLADLRSRFGIAQDEMVIASFGFAIPEKRDHVLLEAFADLQQSREYGKKLKLVFVGQMSDAVGQTLKAVVRKYDIADRIVVTGWTEIDDFVNMMYLATVACNLRYPTNGEVSGCLTRLLMIGKPTIVTDVDAFSEYPDDALIKIRHDDHEKDDLMEALDRFLSSGETRQQCTDRARAYMRAECSLEKAAAGYAAFVERVMENGAYRQDGIGRGEVEAIVSQYRKTRGSDMDPLNAELRHMAAVLSKI
jgi:glycosyltransferase involved in cell wall biosynthesis